MNKEQFGRSMIEMLGVLAIVGVLSIGDLYAFQFVMVRHKTNELIEDVKLAGFIVRSELFESVLAAEEGFISLAGKFTNKPPYTFKALAEENSETTFDIMVENVPEKVCLEALKRKVDWLEEIRANGTENACHESDDNTLDFFFNTELAVQPDLAQNTCRSNRDCPASAPYCRNGYCTKCETGLQLNNGTCTDCPATATDNINPTTSIQWQKARR